MQKLKLRVLWAADPGEEGAAALRNTAEVLRYFATQIDSEIQPVHVMRIAPELVPDFSRRFAPEFKEFTESALLEYAQDARVQDLIPPRVLVHESLSIRGAVDQLVRFANRSHASLIVAQTHSRTGLKRLALGSFTETLLTRSKVPVLVVNQSTRHFRGFRKILFATDFGERARAEFNRVLDIAQTFDSRLTLFHSIEYPIEPLWTWYKGPEWPGVRIPGYVRKKGKEAAKRAESWMQTAARRGVTMDFVIDETGFNISDPIVKLADKNELSLIVMQARSGPVASTVLGSTLRQVVRTAACPVWVIPREGQRRIAGLRPALNALETKAA